MAEGNPGLLRQPWLLAWGSWKSLPERPLGFHTRIPWVPLAILLGTSHWRILLCKFHSGITAAKSPAWPPRGWLFLIMKWSGRRAIGGLNNTVVGNFHGGVKDLLADLQMLPWKDFEKEFPPAAQKDAGVAYSRVLWSTHWHQPPATELGTQRPMDKGKWEPLSFLEGSVKEQGRCSSGREFQL